MVTGRFVFIKVKSPEENANFVLGHSFFRQNEKTRPAKLGLIDMAFAEFDVKERWRNFVWLDSMGYP
jgi:hypothetical protein